MPGGPTHWLVEDLLGFRTSLNEGALFGFGQGYSTAFAVVSVVAALFILYWLFVVGEARDRLLCIALGLVTAGILGNLYDRLGWHGLLWPDFQPGRAGQSILAVRDFIHFTVGSFEWPTFNLADSFLVCGAALLVWHSFQHVPQQPSGNEPPASTDDGTAGA